MAGQRWRDRDGGTEMAGQRWRDRDGGTEMAGQRWRDRDGGTEMAGQRWRDRDGDGGIEMTRCHLFQAIIVLTNECKEADEEKYEENDITDGLEGLKHLSKYSEKLKTRQGDDTS